MFRNRVALRVALPSSAFLLRQLHTPSPSPSPLSIESQSLCWNLSRQFRIACIPQPALILLIYKIGQRELVDFAIEELLGSLPNITVGEEEELQSALLIVKAVEIGLRCVMLDHGWSCVGDNIFINSMLGSDDERTPLCALNVQLQPDIADGCLFLVSPEGLRFNRHKISDVFAANMGGFACGEDVTSEVDNLVKACFVIPSLSEGRLIGVSKLLPAGENFEMLEQLWSLKNGRALHSDCFLFIQLTNEGWTRRQWFPSGYVLQGLSFASAPKSIRTQKAVCAFESFTKLVEEWNFFSDGVVKVKESYMLGTETKCPVWETASKCIDRFSTNTTDKPLHEAGLSLKDLLLALDFRTPKPALSPPHNREMKDTSIKHAETMSMVHVQKKPDYHGADRINFSSQILPSLTSNTLGSVTTHSEVKPKQFLIPSFTKRKAGEAHKDLNSPSKKLLSEVKLQQALVPSFTKKGANQADKDPTFQRSNDGIPIAESKKQVQIKKKDDLPAPKQVIISQSGQSDPEPKFKYPKEQHNFKRGASQADKDPTFQRSNDGIPIAESKRQVQIKKKDDLPAPKQDMVVQSTQSDPVPKFKYPKEQQHNFKRGASQADKDPTFQRSNDGTAIAQSKKLVQIKKKDDLLEPKQDMIIQSAQSDPEPKSKYPKEQHNFKSSTEINCSTNQANVLQEQEEFKASRIDCIAGQGNASSVGTQKESAKKKLKSNGEKKLHIRETAEGSTKIKEKQVIDQSEIVAKVTNYHKSGALQSLTVPELKIFLTSRKTKVGGKKEELIQRITALLA